MANSITLASDSYFGREFIFTVTQYGTSTIVNWTFEVTQMDAGNGTRADVSGINCMINGYSVYSYPATGWSQSTKFPVYYGSTSGSYDIGSYGTFNVVLSGRPGYTTATSKSVAITLIQPAPEPPEPHTPTTNKISVNNLPNFLAGYDGDTFSLSCIPSGGTGYIYKWYRGATNIGTSQNLSGILSNSAHDNTSVYCVVVDETGGTATTNKCEFRVGTTASQTQVPAKRTKLAWVYNENQFLYFIPFIYNKKWLYADWNINEVNSNRADIAIVGKAIAG